MWKLDGYAMRVATLTNLMFLPCLLLTNMAFRRTDVALAVACAYSLSGTTAYLVKTIIGLGADHLRPPAVE
jgi:hypothetical protein